MTSPPESSGSSLEIFSVSDEVIDMIAQIKTLDDVTPEHLHSLKVILERQVALPIFDITREQFKILHEKSINFGLTGIEYHGHFSRLVLKPYPNHLVQAVIDGIGSWFQQTAKFLQDEGHRDWVCPSTRCYDLSGQYSGTVKEADLYLSRITESFPCIALCVSYKEARVEVLDDAKHWLYGSENNTQAVIAVEVTERNCPDLKESWVYSVDFSMFESANALAKDVIYMENAEGPTMVGVFVASLWILTPSNLSSDAYTLPSPAYVYECTDPSGLGVGRVTGCFSGSECIREDFSIQVLGASTPLDFVQFEEKLLKGIVEFRANRMSNLAFDAWEKHVNARNQSMCL